MSLTIVDRPFGYKLSTTENTAAVTSSSGALFTNTGHGLSTGNFIYIKSTIGGYNGFWYVEVIDPNTFKIREYATKAVEAFVIAGSVTYFISILTHRFVAVHLPIVYKLQSDLWPVNSADTARTVSSFSNYNGYTALNLSGDIKATGIASALEQVIIDGSTELDGVYKILNWFSDTSIVIDLAYSAAHSFGGTIQYYYHNYHARVRVYAGLDPLHTHEPLKPFEQVAEIRCLPDSTGLIKVNIADFLKKKIEIIKNNLLLETLPNNIDAFCQFYISVAESYDDSNGYTVEEYVSAYSDDAQVLVAVNADLPFKGRYINHLSQWLNGGSSDSYQDFMTMFAEPVLFHGKYFDVSFLIDKYATTYQLEKKIYVDDVLVDTIIQAITNSDVGVYRAQIEQSGWSEDRIDLTLYRTTGAQQSNTITIRVAQECANQSIYLTWLNYIGGFDYWDFTARKTYSVNVEESKTQEKNIFTNWPNSYGEFADTIRQQTSRSSRNSIRVESQHLTQAQADAIAWIVSSPLVQIVTSVYDRRTVIVDGSSLRKYKDQDKTFTVSFTISYTDELPSQSL